MFDQPLQSSCGLVPSNSGIGVLVKLLISILHSRGWPGVGMFGTLPEVKDEEMKLSPRSPRHLTVSFSYAQFHMDVTDVESQHSAGGDLSQEHWKSFVPTCDYGTSLSTSAASRSCLDFVRCAKNAAKAMSFPLPPRLRRRLTDFETTKEAKILRRSVDVVSVFFSLWNGSDSDSILQTDSVAQSFNQLQ